MSQSSKVLKEFGSVSLLVDKSINVGSETAIVPIVTPAPTALADGDATATVAQLKTGIFTMTPTATRIVTLPTAVLMKAYLSQVGATVDFSVVNSGADGFSVTIAAGSGGSIIGFADVRDSVVTSNPDSGSAIFRIRATNVTTGSEAYIVYRLS